MCLLAPNGSCKSRLMNSAPLPTGTIEAGAQNQDIPRPSAKDQFKMSNSTTPSNPQSLAKRLFNNPLGMGKAPTDADN